MATDKYIIGRGTKIFVAPLPECQRVMVPFTVLAIANGATAPTIDPDTGELIPATPTTPTTGTTTPTTTPATTTPTTPTTGTTTPPTAIAANATEIPLQRPVPYRIAASATYPVFVNFEEPNGKIHLVKIIAAVEAGATSLAVAPLKRPISRDAIAVFPLILKSRTNANLTDNDNSVDIMTFDNDGWRDQTTTMLGHGLECGGHYSPLDAGWNTCFQARLNFAEIYWELHLPKPGCDVDKTYKRGHVFRGFGGIQMPINTPADNIIEAPITITSRGKVTILDPV